MCSIRGVLRKKAVVECFYVTYVVKACRASMPCSHVESKVYSKHTQIAKTMEILLFAPAAVVSLFIVDTGMPPRLRCLFCNFDLPDPDRVLRFDESSRDVSRFDT